MNEKHPGLRESLRALPRGAWVLFLGTFLNKFGTFVVPFLAIYVTGLGYNAAQAGLAIAAYGVGNIGAAFIGGQLTDQFGRRKTIVLSMFMGAAMMLGLSQARSLPTIMAFSFLVGLAGELYRPACSALLADLVPAGQRVTAFAAYRMAINAGFAFGSATAGFIAKVSFMWLFVGDAATSILFGLVAWFALPAGLRGTRAENSLFETARVLRQDKRLRQMVFAALATGLVFVQVFSTMSLEITHSGYSPAIYGLLISINGAVIVFFELPLTTVTRRFPARRVIALGYVLIGLGFATNALPRLMPLLVLTMVLITLGEMIAMPVSGAYIADLAPPERRGLYMGTYSLVWSLAFVLGPSLGMTLFSASRLALWLGCGVLGLLASSIILRDPQPALREQAPDQRPTAVGEISTPVT